MVGLIVLVLLLKLHIAKQNTLLCAGLYAGYSLLWSLLQGASVMELVLGPPFHFGLAYAYFFMLAKIESTSLWWVAAIGSPIGFGLLTFYLFAETS